MYTKALSLALAAALLGLAAAQAPATCSDAHAYTYSLDQLGSFDAIRIQSLDSVTVKTTDVTAPTVVVYLPDDNVDEPFKPLNLKLEHSEALVGAANGDRAQCVHIELPSNFGGVESILSDDYTNVLLEGGFTLDTMKLVVINGNFYTSNDTSTSLSIGTLTLNNTGVGGIFFTDSSDSATDLEVINNGNGEIYYMGSANDVSIHHDGVGNIFLGTVANEMVLSLTGQGEIATDGASTLSIVGTIKHPYRVFYKDGAEEICKTLEVEPENVNFEPCLQSSDPIADALAATSTPSTTFAG